MLAVLTRVSSGASTGVVVELVQCVVSPGQVGSPPPLTVAVFASVVPLALACGVTGIVKLVLAPMARPAAIVQLTVWPVALQPAGRVPMLRPAGSVSLTVATAVVAALPVLLTCKV